MADLRKLREITKELERQKVVMDSHNETAKSYQQAQVKIKSLSADIVNIEREIAKTKEKYSVKSDQISLGKQISKLEEGMLGKLQKKFRFEDQIAILKKRQKSTDKAQVESAKKYADLLEGVVDGSMDLESVLNKIATEDFGIMNELAEDLAKTLEGTPDLSKKLGIEAKFQKGIGKIQEMLDGIDIGKTFSFAGALAAVTAFASKTLDIKQSLGTAGGESIRLAANVSAAGASAKLLGGNAQEAQAAVEAMTEEFGSLSVVSLQTSVSIGKMVSDTGLSGANAAKLLSSMQSISGASIETNIALIQSAKELARAEGVAPAQVLNDIASDTETFATFAKGGGENLIKAGIAARKLGLNLGTVAGIAEKLLDFESSIESSMEASVLLGRQVNTDKARELALSGDLEGLAKEIKSQVGSQAEFEAMNVVQRQKLAEAMGVTVSDLGKIIRGEQTSAEATAEKAKQQELSNTLQLDMNKLMLFAQGITATIATIQAGINLSKGIEGMITKKNARGELSLAGATIVRAAAAAGVSAAAVPVIGVGLALAAIAGVGAAGYAMLSKAPKAETGGMVTKSGLAEIHKGEAISGTKNEMGFGADMAETNKILKESLAESRKLRSQNQALMNTLTNKVTELSLG